MNSATQLIHRLHEEEIKLLGQLRLKRRNKEERRKSEFTVGDRIAKGVKGERIAAE